MHSTFHHQHFYNLGAVTSNWDKVKAYMLSLPLPQEALSSGTEEEISLNCKPRVLIKEENLSGNTSLLQGWEYMEPSKLGSWTW